MSDAIDCTDINVLAHTVSGSLSVGLKGGGTLWMNAANSSSTSTSGSDPQRASLDSS